VDFFTEDDVLRLLSMPEAIEALRAAFLDYRNGKAFNQPRRRLFLPTGAVLHSMAGAWGAYLGTKIYTTHPRHAANFTFLLYDAATAKPLAQFEANHLGQLRTGAASGLAANLLAPEGEVSVAVIGSGFQARTQLQAVAAVRRVKQARVWSRHADKRTSFAAAMVRDLSLDVIPAQSAADATRGAALVITATWSKDPVIAASDIEPGALVIAVGSNNPERRELPSDLVQNARIVVDDIDACRLEAGDLLLGLHDAAWQQIVELKNLLANKAKAGHEDRLTIFKSVGLGLEDVAAAAVVYEKSIPARKSADPNPAMH
jgi:ornithine cyclodeaminase/alanine dehydrogenase-like protein (mu-crystallin family)